MVTRWSRSTSNFYALTGQNLTGEFMRKIYTASWILFTFVSTYDVFNSLFPLDVQNEIQLLSGVFCYSWLVCLLGFWLRNASLVKVGNPISDGIVFVFHLAWCVRGFKRGFKRSWRYLIALRNYLSNEKHEHSFLAWVIIVIYIYIHPFSKRFSYREIYR